MSVIAWWSILLLNYSMLIEGKAWSSCSNSFQLQLRPQQNFNYNCNYSCEFGKSITITHWLHLSTVFHSLVYKNSNKTSKCCHRVNIVRVIAMQDSQGIFGNPVLISSGAIQVLRNAFFLGILPPPTLS